MSISFELCRLPGQRVISNVVLSTVHLTWKISMCSLQHDVYAQDSYA